MSAAWLVAFVVAVALGLVGGYLVNARQNAERWAPSRREIAEGYRGVVRDARAMIEKLGDPDGRMTTIAEDCAASAVRCEREADRMWTWPFTERERTS